MALKVAINGFGRIGRSVARIIANRSDVELVAINDLTEPEMIKYLLDNDSVHGNFGIKTEILEDSYLRIGETKVKIFSDKDPENVHFGKEGAEVVLECTGVFLTKEKAKVHLRDGVKKVVFSAPAKDDTDTFVIGVNSEEYAGQDIV
jgi:glyceraldehyde 3-phosphate dehydrogenase